MLFSLKKLIVSLARSWWRFEGVRHEAAPTVFEASLTPSSGATVAVMGTYSAQQRELLEELGKLGRPVAGALPPGAEPPVWRKVTAQQIRDDLKNLYRMTDAEIDYAIESL